MAEPEFFIINDMDKPCERHVVQKIGPHQYKYLHPDLANWNIMEDSKMTTNMKDFGFSVTIEGNRVHFRQTGLSCAKYYDGSPRQWQGEDEFVLLYQPGIVKLVEEYEGEAHV